jgi:dynein heavy chain 1
MLLASTALTETKNVSPQLLGGKLSKTQLAELETLVESEEFNNILENMDAEEASWVNMLDHTQAEDNIPEPWKDGDDISVTNKYARCLKKLIVLKLLRPDRLVNGVKQFLALVLGDEITSVGQVNLNEFVSEAAPKNPLLLVSAVGFDASYKVDQIAKQANKKYTSIAIGSPEAFA